MKFLPLTFYLAFTAIVAIAQSGNRFQDLPTDSMERLLANSKPDTNQVLLHSHLIMRYILSDKKIAMQHAQQGLTLARKLGFQKGEADCLRRSGIMVEQEGRYPEALEIFLTAMKISEQINDPYGIAASQQQIGEIHYAQGEYFQALFNFFQNEKISERLHDNNSLGVGLRSIGRCYMQLNKLDSALIYINKSYELLKNSSIAIRHHLLYDFGNLYSKMGKDSIALSYFRKSISIFFKYNDTFGLNLSHQGMAVIFKKRGYVDSCIFYAKKAVEGAQRSHNLKIVFEASQLLSEVYEGINEHEAYKYYKIATAANDSLFNVEKVRQVQNLLFAEQQSQQTKAVIEQAYQNKLKLYALFTALGVFILLAVILYRNNLGKQKANSLLQQKNYKIESTLTELKSTQAQLIQSEKMASLGELTAGIAHEIQNPLNFVNNFSDVNTELIAEMKDEIDKGNYDEVKLIANDLEENEEKINHHGKRADAIVKGMLQHSRQTTGIKEPTDINALCDEYLRLAYHGLRAKDKSFNAEIKTDFDNSVGNVTIIPQDIGRVLLNLYNNAFYAVAEQSSYAKASEDKKNYEPTVSVGTKKILDKSDSYRIEIKVADNGNGIPENVVDKIFQPFFTTKPTGEGTGLGLSLSYDIVKAHGGEIKVETKEGEGSEFIIQLPLT